MKFLIILLYLINGSFSLYASELEIEVVGKTTRQNSIDLPSGKKYVSFRHEGGFETSISRYGSYMCDGNILFNKQENLESDNFNQYEGKEAYQTLVNWVKSVPNAIKEIEENGSKEELIRYKKQIKMVVEKLKEIKNNFPEVND